MRQLAEAQVPPASPEIAQGRGGKRRLHDRARIHSGGPPQKRQNVERAKVQDQNNSQHGYPTRKEFATRRNATRDAPEQQHRGGCLRNCP